MRLLKLATTVSRPIFWTSVFVNGAASGAPPSVIPQFGVHSETSGGRGPHRIPLNSRSRLPSAGPPGHAPGRRRANRNSSVSTPPRPATLAGTFSSSVPLESWIHVPSAGSNADVSVASDVQAGVAEP